MIWKEAIVADYTDRVVPVLRNTKRFVLTDSLTPISKYFRICSSSREAADLIYDLPILVIRYDGKSKQARLSATLDILFISAWAFTLGINPFGSSLQVSITHIPNQALAKIERVMEHHLDLGDLVYKVNPTFDRSLFQSVKVCHVRLDHKMPKSQALANQIGGGPYTPADLLRHYTDHFMYEEVICP